MDEEQVEVVAKVFRGTPWNSGGGVNLVRIERPDGCLVVISDEAICEYESEEAFDENQPARSILLH